MEKRFRKLLAEYQNRVFQFAVLLLGHHQEAEDVTQDTLIVLWRHLPRLRPGEELGWMMACVRNACLDRLRGRSRRRRLLRLVPAPDPVVTPDHMLAAAERESRLRALLLALPEPARSLLILRDVQGLPVADTARVIGLSETQVKVYTFRARRELRRRLEEVENAQAA